MGATQVERDGIKDDAISSEKIPDNAVGTSEIADGAVTLAKLANGTSDGLVLTSNDGSAPTFNTPTVEGTDVKSTNISGTTKYLRADGDGTCSWDVPQGAGLVDENGNGLAPQLPNPHGGKFLKADGTWTVPYYAVSGTDAPGLVPALPDSSVQTINFLRGDGSWAELNYTVSSTTTGDVGTDASVSLSGNAFSFTIPRGATGGIGPDGNAATVDVHSTVTGDVGSTASVTNEGSNVAANFKFTIPRGNTGNPGTPGTDGTDGKTVLNGTDDPTSEGSVGDFYINTDSNELFGPKDGSGWGSGTSLVGPSQTGAQIKTAYEGESNTNAFTDGDKVKLNFIDLGATRAGLYTSFARLEDRKAYNVTGGTCIADYQNRDLNTEAYDPDGIVLGLNNISTGTTKSNGSSTYTVATNTDEFALGAGTYVFIISCPAASVARTFFYLRERDLDDNDTNLNHPSTVEYSNGFNATVRPQMFLRRTISATRKFVIRQFTSSANTNSNALGIPMYGGSGTTNPGSSRDNVYSVVEIYKEYT